MTGAHAENPTLDLPCRTVFAAGERATEVVGPLLEEEAAALRRISGTGTDANGAVGLRRHGGGSQPRITAMPSMATCGAWSREPSSASA